MLVPLLGCTVSVLAQSAAQSLGTPTAARAWVGRPLEMTVPARFATTDVRDECVHADVFFGDNRLHPGQVRTSVLPTSDPEQKRVRIATTTLIDEPVVTVSLRAGCSGAITRSYTLLPEMPTEQMIASLLSPAGAPAQLLASAPGGATGGAPPLRLARGTSPRIAPVAGEAAVAQAPVPPAPRARTPRAARATEAMAAGPRLRLEPIEADSRTLLRVSAMLADPQGDAGRRATAAMLWQAINADPADLMRTTVLLQKLENDLVQLRQNAAQTRADMEALRRRLDQPQPWYQSASMVQLLSLMLLALVATVGVLWLRARRAGGLPAWYAPAASPVVQPLQADEAAAGTRDDGAPTQAVSSLQAARLEAAEPASAPAGAQLAAPADHGGTIDFDLPAVPAARTHRSAADGVLRVETLAATFAEAEFLCSLGLSRDAADVLKTYLQDSASPAPVAFFELMRLWGASDDSGAVAAVRRRYVQVFGAEPPAPEQVGPGPGLDSLPALSARITAAWGTSEVLALIEDALFSVPDPAAPLTLQAGRDLLCLHDVAMRLQAERAESAAGIDADGHALAPWAHVDDPAAAHAAMYSAEADVPAVDIDLDAVPPPEPLPQPEFDPAMELSLDHPDVAPLIAEMQAAARAAEERAAAARRMDQEEDAFSAAVASERSHSARL
jgi:hypothetical protein